MSEIQRNCPFKTFKLLQSMLFRVILKRRNCEGFLKNTHYVKCFAFQAVSYEHCFFIHYLLILFSVCEQENPTTSQDSQNGLDCTFLGSNPGPFNAHVFREQVSPIFYISVRPHVSSIAEGIVQYLGINIQYCFCRSHQ